MDFADHVVLFSLICLARGSYFGGKLLKICQGQGSINNIVCGDGLYIKIDWINQISLTGTTCPISTNDKCIANFSDVKIKCNGQHNCTIEENDLKPSICFTYQRNSRLYYKCTRRRYYPVHFHSQICSHDWKIECPYKFKISDAYWSQLHTETFSECDRPWTAIKSCLEYGLNECIGENQCGYTNNENDWCFYFPFSVIILYTCVKEPTTGAVNVSKGTESTFPVMTTTPSIEMQINSTKDTETVTLYLDPDNRLLVFNHSNSKTYSLCLYNWGDTEASVVCRQLNLSRKGIAGHISRDSSLERLSFEVSCSGDETSLKNCVTNTSITIDSECPKLGDATVDCSDYSSKEEAQSGKKPLNTGLLVGLAVGGLLIILICITATIVWKRRCKKASSKSEQINSPVIYQQNKGYVHFDDNQELQTETENPALKTNGNQNMVYQVLDPTATGYNRSNNNRRDQYNTSGRLESESHYVCTTEDVYDVSNQRRHIDKNDGNIYNHCVDGVYDTSGEQLNKDIHDDENIYNHTVDGVYDTSTHCQDKYGDKYNTYNDFAG